MRNENRFPHRQEGYVIVTVAVLLVVLLGFSALAVDSGVLYSSRTSAQRIADSAALAGASTFIADPNAAQPATAEAEARAFAENKMILGDTVQAGEVTVQVDIPNRRVTVDILRTEETYLAKAIGFTSSDVGVTATAEAGAVFAGSPCIKPWFLPNSIFIDPSESACAACPGQPNYDPAINNKLLIKPGASGLEVSPFAQTMINSQAVNGPTRLKPNNPANALEPGQFYAIQLGNGSGASVYGDNILGCAGLDPAGPSPIRCGDCFKTEPGNMVGPTTANTEALIGHPSHDGLDLTALPQIAINDNNGSPVNVLQSSSRISVPIWDICSDGTALSCGSPTGFCPGEALANHGANVFFRVVGFADIFVADVQRGQGVDIYLLGVNACPSSPGGGVNPGGIDASNVLGFPLRLVRPPSP